MKLLLQRIASQAASKHDNQEILPRDIDFPAHHFSENFILKKTLKSLIPHSGWYDIIPVVPFCVP